VTSHPFSLASLAALGTCHPDLQRLVYAVADRVDCSVLCGHRDEATQERLYREGKTRAHWPHSRHNSQPSMAVDLAPYPVNWQDLDRFRWFGGFVQGIAVGLGIEIVWGGNWKGFADMPHFELAAKEST
jgi:peptidoglycan L-alanyl-D-glutamate endopeptidase CwlK